MKITLSSPCLYHLMWLYPESQEIHTSSIFSYEKHREEGGLPWLQKLQMLLRSLQRS